ncbi:Dynein light chain [Aphelenchoides bicaudatus]|nr:Dynein light chain [Aphelenchoides bicaudatus]
MLQRKKFSIRRNGTKRWRYAQTGREDGTAKEQMSVIIHTTNFDLDLQKYAVDVANQALDQFRIENEVASFIKSKFDEVGGPAWQVIVGKNFGAHIACERYIHFRAAKIIIIIYQ